MGRYYPIDFQWDTIIPYAHSNMNLSGPLRVVGFTVKNQEVLGGTFQLADTHGFSLTDSLEQARKYNMVVSFPHYFAIAIEAGWDDEMVFRRIREAIRDSGDYLVEHEQMRLILIYMFMEVAKKHPGKLASEIGKEMRLEIEADALASFRNKLYDLAVITNKELTENK